jgi:D-alanine-D-alanine ligase-like ATP-grasp enzyme
MLKEMNLGLVRMNESETILTGVQYMLSKWERNLGDTLTIDGVKWRVGIIGDTKNDVISALNEIIKKQNSIINKKKYQQRKEEKFIMNNILNNVMKDITL